jgi:large subunit ribosomal protein L25
VADVRLNAQLRTEFGKGGARRARRAGLIPAVIYGHGEQPRHISLPEREFTNAIKKGGTNALLTLRVDGADHLAITKAIQRDAIKGSYRHVDLLTVRRGEKITVDVRLEIVGELVRGALLAQEHTSVSIEAEATHLPGEIVVDLTGLEIGTQVKASDLTLPSGSVLAGDPEQVLLIVNEAPTESEPETATAAVADAEGEGAAAGDGDSAGESEAE